MNSSKSNVTLIFITLNLNLFFLVDLYIYE
nr:MAG TPA_asm: hypothetical protein [Bacteriophage sp.]